MAEVLIEYICLDAGAMTREPVKNYGKKVQRES